MLEENLGCPGGRNAGLRLMLGPGDVDVVVELDDDGLLIADDVFARVQRLYAADPELGILSFRIADERGQTLRRHVPRLRDGDPLRRGPVTAFLGGGHALSAPMLRQIGDWPGHFFFEHEETDLAWRALDAGWEILYEPDLVLQHPRTPPERHAVHYRMTARNRVWLARRRMPAMLVPAYLGVWIAITVARTHSPAALRTWAAGFLEEVRTPCGPRQPMRWRTVWRMTRLGRPPLICPLQRSPTRDPLSWWASRRAPWRWQVQGPAGVTIADRKAASDNRHSKDPLAEGQQERTSAFLLSWLSPSRDGNAPPE